MRALESGGAGCAGGGGSAGFPGLPTLSCDGGAQAVASTASSATRSTDDLGFADDRAPSRRWAAPRGADPVKRVEPPDSGDAAKPTDGVEPTDSADSANAVVEEGDSYSMGPWTQRHAVGSASARKRARTLASAALTASRWFADRLEHARGDVAAGYVDGLGIARQPKLGVDGGGSPGQIGVFQDDLYVARSIEVAALPVAGAQP